MEETWPENRGEVLERNGRIDRKVVKAYKKLERELLDLGVQPKPRYALEPPLGRRPKVMGNRDK